MNATNIHPSTWAPPHELDLRENFLIIEPLCAFHPFQESRRFPFGIYPPPLLPLESRAAAVPYHWKVKQQQCWCRKDEGIFPLSLPFTSSFSSESKDGSKKKSKQQLRYDAALPLYYLLLFSASQCCFRWRPFRLLRLGRLLHQSLASRSFTEGPLFQFHGFYIFDSFSFFFFSSFF